MYLYAYVLVEVLVACGLVILLPRTACLWLAAIFLAAGIALPAILIAYANAFIPGDRSSFGMFATICAAVLALPGIIMALGGLLKGR
ncbi:MAG: hypothetical protein ACR2IE_10850 [Candidatus Sumerlaeaceae bacterium]